MPSPPNGKLALGLLLVAASLQFHHSSASAQVVEPGCPGGLRPNPDVLLCDSFEDGSFLQHWAIGSMGGTLPSSLFVLCGAGLGFNDRCAAWSSKLLFDGSWGFWGLDGWRLFQPQQEFYVRWYQYMSDSYVWGSLEDKSVMLHDPPYASITAYVGTSRNQLPYVPNSGPGKPFVANYQDVDWPETGWQYTRVNRFQNQGNDITVQPGRWYLFEWYVKINTPGVSDGITKLWVDDATEPIATQTLRLQYNDMRWLRNSDASKQFGFLRLATYHQRCDGDPNTCPPNGPSTLNQSQRFDHVVVSRKPVGPIRPWLSPVAAGGFSTCVLLSDRTARCMGRNVLGQLGNGTWNSSTDLVPVSGLTTASSISAGNEHSCALIEDGTIRCWGTNYTGQLGDGTLNTYSNVPVTVQNITNAIAVVTGGFHTCAVVSDNTVSCWGRNADGQVGQASRTDQTRPVTVAGLDNVFALSAGGYHTCAIMPNRTIRCWGRNDDGQLGDGSRMSSSMPLQVAGITTAAAISGGGYHQCALLQNGTVQCWGKNDYGQVGRPSSTAAYMGPVPVPGVSGAVAVVAGGYHSCAVLADGTTRCWGRNEFGELGDGTTVNSSTPVRVNGIANPSAVSLGAWHTCAVLPSLVLQCWGANANGQLGPGGAVDLH